MKLSELATILKCTLKGEDKEITGVNTLQEASANELSFLSNPKYIKQLADTKAAAVILKVDLSENIETALISEKPYEDFARTIAMFAKPQGFLQGVSPLAYVHESAKIGENCTIYPFATIGKDVVLGDNCTIFSSVYIGEETTLGNNCTIYPNAVIMGKVKLGNACCIQPGAVVGAEGFGFVPTPMGIQKIPQIGTVEFGDKVELGANSCVDRAALSATKVGDGTAIDNLVQLGHNVEVGKNCLIISQTGVAGSTSLGDNVTLAAQCGIAGHLHIGSGSTLAPKSGVAKDIPENVVMGGSPATDQRTYMRTLTLMPKYPEIFTRLNKIEKLLNIKEEK